MAQLEPQITAIRAESWENEGGSIASLELAQSLGVTRHVTQSYSVGGYHYTNIKDAIAQARRMTALERELL